MGTSYCLFGTLQISQKFCKIFLPDIKYQESFLYSEILLDIFLTETLNLGMDHVSILAFTTGKLRGKLVTELQQLCFLLRLQSIPTDFSLYSLLVSFGILVKTLSLPLTSCVTLEEVTYTFGP